MGGGPTPVLRRRADGQRGNPAGEVAAGNEDQDSLKVVISADAETLNSLKVVEQEIGSANTATIAFQQGDALKVSVQPSEEPGGGNPL